MAQAESSGNLEHYFVAGGPLEGTLEGFTPRRGQVELATAVGAAIAGGTVLMAEAATGTGKTLAYLIPAILSSKKVVISTATKTLQTQIMEKDAPLAAATLGRRISIHLLKGRQNYLCLRRFKRFKSRALIKLGRDDELLAMVQDWAAGTTTGDRAELVELPENFETWRLICSASENCWGSKCPQQADCFFNNQRRAAQKAQIVVVNHHLFFADLAVKTSTQGEVLPRYSAVIFDEAHHLETVATQYFGVRVSSHQVSELVRDARALNSDCEDTVARVECSANLFFDLLAPAGEKLKIGGALEGETGEKLQPLLGALEEMGRFAGATEEDDREWDSIGRRTGALTSDLKVFTADPSVGEVRWAEARGRGCFLHAVPVEVGPTLETTLFTERLPVVLTSATLRVGSSFDYLRARLGVPEEASEVAVDGPFDFASQCLIYVPRDLPMPSSEEFSLSAAERIKQLLELTSGRAFCLFTSHRALRIAAEELRGSIPYKLLIQGEAPRDSLLEEFRSDTHSVLLGAQSFWEGVDVPGETLSAVIIDRLPFASPGDPLVEARIEKVRADGGNPFKHYQVPLAAMALRQGVGRLIRRLGDRGLVAVLDRRLMERGYGATFRKSLPDAPYTREPRDIERFFAE